MDRRLGKLPCTFRDCFPRSSPLQSTTGDMLDITYTVPIDIRICSGSTTSYMWSSALSLWISAIYDAVSRSGTGCRRGFTDEQNE